MVSRRPVRALDPLTVNQIAAGEVVERPASVVKELVENALDAGATQIDVELEDSGRTRIVVRDNGVGMSPEDARLALQRHATSKISTTDDLNEVRTLGFRGEALPSIASVSRMKLVTATEDGARVGLRIDGGTINDYLAAAGPRGTEITVEDLFFNTPARLKFLKSDTTELGQSLDHISRYAIANPHVAFRVTHNGHLALTSPGTGDMQEAIASMWNRDIARSMAAIDTVLNGIHFRGYVTPPHITKPTRNYQFLYVNGRPVRTRNLTAAIDVAFRDITPEKRFPMLALNLEVDPARIDVNVSPTKSEVKFQSEGAAFDAIRMALKSSLLAHGMIPDASQIAAANEALAAIRTAQLGDSPAFAPVVDYRPSVPAPLPAVPAGDPFEAGHRDETAGSDQAAIAMPWDRTEILAESGLTSSARMPFLSLLDDLRIIGQVMNTFIIAETRHGVIIIDQHVAHERVIYEYLCGIKGQVPVEKQPLLIPQTLHLDRRAAVLIADRLDEIRAVGFDIEPFGGESFVVRAAPAALRGRDAVAVLQEMVDELIESTVTRRLVPTREQIWITTSCKMAVKAGDPLSHAEMERLIHDLATTENPYLCPHGRPITATLSRDAMLRLFKRI